MADDKASPLLFKHFTEPNVGMLLFHANSSQLLNAYTIRKGLMENAFNYMCKK